MVDYNSYAKTFSQSRKNMKWEEIDYFLKYLEEKLNSSLSILDVWCGNGRLLNSITNYKLQITNYIGIDLSSELLNEAKKLHSGYDFLELDMLNLKKLCHTEFISGSFKLDSFINNEVNANNYFNDSESSSEWQSLFDIIFFIASFHHLQTIDERLEVLNQAKDLLKEWWLIFMTNWDLNAWKNKEKYKSSIIKDSENEFWSLDFDIKIGDFSRYYHSFSIQELEYLYKKSWFEIIENRLFDTEKNIISIIKK